MSRVECILARRALLELILDLARDVGRLRRRVDPESSLAHLVGRIGDRVQTIDVIVYPTAAELLADFFCISGDEELSLEEALRVVDDRARTIRAALEINIRRCD